MTQITLNKLHGDASNRIYYRLSLDNKSFIIMQLPEGAMSASEEITNLKQKPKELPFLEIQKYLEGVGVRVPQVFVHQDRLVFLEDLGDITFEKQFRTLSSATDQEKLYQKAIDLLILFQEKTKTGKCIAHERSFDETLLNWEFEHFFEYGITARTGEKITDSDLKILRQESQKITKTLIQLPQVFVHRDFQSKNLMLLGDELVVLDFQDALMGPLPYDLVALLRDSYIKIEPSMLDRLVDYYANRRGDPCDRPIEGANTRFAPTLDFRQTFDLMTIQRKLKDAGRFVYIDRVKKNPSFLQHIPNSLIYLKDAFERQKDLKVFYEVLKKYVPEWN